MYEVPRDVMELFIEFKDTWLRQEDEDEPGPGLENDSDYIVSVALDDRASRASSVYMPGYLCYGEVADAEDRYERDTPVYVDFMDADRVSSMLYNLVLVVGEQIEEPPTVTHPDMDTLKPDDIFAWARRAFGLLREHRAEA